MAAGITVNVGGSAVGDSGKKVAVKETPVLAGLQALTRMIGATRMSVLLNRLSPRRIARHNLRTIVCSFFVFTVPSTQ